MENFRSQYGEVQIEFNSERNQNCIIVKTDNNELGRSEIELIMQEFADANSYGEVGEANEFEENTWSAKVNEH
jgi:hypothetical protein